MGGRVPTGKVTKGGGGVTRPGSEVAPTIEDDHSVSAGPVLPYVHSSH